MNNVEKSISYDNWPLWVRFITDPMKNSWPNRAYSLTWRIIIVSIGGLLIGIFLPVKYNGTGLLWLIVLDAATKANAFRWIDINSDWNLRPDSRKYSYFYHVIFWMVLGLLYGYTGLDSSSIVEQFMKGWNSVEN